MNERQLLFSQLSLLVILLIFHVVASVNFLYWRFHGIDVPAHILGGIWAGLFASWLLVRRGKRPRLVFCITIAITFSIIWESFEAYTGQTHFPADIADTIKDISMGIAGSVVGFFLARGKTA